MEDIKRLVGQRIRSLRKEKGLSQEELGEKAGFHYTYMGGVERGEKNPSLDTLNKIAGALGVGIVELFPAPQRLNQKKAKALVLETVRSSSPEMVKLFSDLIESIKHLPVSDFPFKKGK
jgi:transcriptional regulator with XRE-family HTH domain